MNILLIFMKKRCIIILVMNMAFTVPYRIYFSDSSNEDGNRLEFLHEIIKSPRPEEAEIFAKNEFNGSHTQDYYELIFLKKRTFRK